MELTVHLALYSTKFKWMTLSVSCNLNLSNSFAIYLDNDDSTWLTGTCQRLYVNYSDTVIVSFCLRISIVSGFVLPIAAGYGV